MNKLVKCVATSLTVLVLLSVTSYANAQADFVLKNLERERAALLKVLINDPLAVAERQLKVQASYRRLVAAEQMALRFEQNQGEVSQLAKQIFTQYDLAFMLHASAEHSHSVIEHWLSQLKLSDQDIEQGWAGER